LIFKLAQMLDRRAIIPSEFTRMNVPHLGTIVVFTEDEEDLYRQ